MRHHHKRGLRAVAVIAALGITTTGVLASGAGAQSSSDPGITTKDVTLGYISPQTGAAAATGQSANKSCQARVDAENAKGGVNGRKIKVEYVDDQSSTANLTVAKDLVENRDVFAVINNSALAFLTWRYLKDEGVPMIGGGFDGSYYYDEGNENIISALGNGTTVPGLTYDNITQQMKKLGAKKVAAVGYGISPSSSESAKATETFGAKAAGLDGVYLNTTLGFGGTDVAPIVLGIKNSGADGLYLPLDAATNFAIVQGLQQNGVDMKVNMLATGYGQDLLDQPIAKTIQPTDVMFSTYRPVELGGPAVKKFQANLKKYAGFTGVPDYGTYTGYIVCDIAILGLKNAGKNPTRQGFVDAIRKTNNGKYDGAGLLCNPTDLSYEAFGTIAPTSCSWFINVKNGKFNILNGGKPLTGKLIGDPDLIKQYTARGGTGVTTTTAAPAS